MWRKMSREEMIGDITKGKDGDSSKGKPEERRWKVASFLLFPWLACFTTAAVSILATVLFFQLQLVSFQKDLTALKDKLSNFSVLLEEHQVRSLRKRSSDLKEDLTKYSSGLQAAHFQGSFPIQHIQKQGRIGPWYVSTSEPTFINMREGNTEIEITQKGIYFIYAQVYYLTTKPSNTYQIMWHNDTDDVKKHRCLSTCSTLGRNSMGDVSCYTGLTASFHPGERLYLNQIEQNRMIRFGNGCTQFGVVLLREEASLERDFQHN